MARTNLRGEEFLCILRENRPLEPPLAGQETPTPVPASPWRSQAQATITTPAFINLRKNFLRVTPLEIFPFCIILSPLSTTPVNVIARPEGPNPLPHGRGLYKPEA